MATIQAGTSFPTELVTEIFNAVRGHSALAKLSDRKPIPFRGVTEFVFTADGEAQLVAEGAQKEAGDAAMTPVIIKPLKFVYQQRVSDEFLKSSDEGRLQYLEAFAEGFARKIARGFDIAAMHGLEPSTATAVLGLTSIDGVIADTGNTVAYDASAIDENIEDAIAMLGSEGVTGIALSPAAGAALGSLKVNGVPQFPEYRFGQNPDAFYGMRSDVNSTVSVAASGDTPDQVIVGDFTNAFKWGYVDEIPVDVIRYGDPDGAGRDLKAYNEVCLRGEAYIGWGILDPNAFAVVNGAAVSQ